MRGSEQCTPYLTVKGKSHVGEEMPCCGAFLLRLRLCESSTLVIEFSTQKGSQGAFGLKNVRSTVFNPPLTHFVLPATLDTSGETLAERASTWAARVRARDETIASVQTEIDNLVFGLYGLEDADRIALTTTLSTEASGDTKAEASEDDEYEATADVSVLTTDLLSYSLGAAFGRWDIRFATGEKTAPELSDPFAPLPVCPLRPASERARSAHHQGRSQKADGKASCYRSAYPPSIAPEQSTKSDSALTPNTPLVGSFGGKGVGAFSFHQRSVECPTGLDTSLHTAKLSPRWLFLLPFGPQIKPDARIVFKTALSK